MALKAAQVLAFRPTDTPRKYYDGGGLYVEVFPNGSKRWRFRYRFAGKHKLISLGLFPKVSLADARKERDTLRALLDEGIEPSLERQSRKAAQVDERNTFEAIGREWLETIHKASVVATHYERNRRRLELYVFPKIGRRPINSIEPPDVLGVLRSIEHTGKRETAHRLRTVVSQIFRYAIQTGRAQRDAAADLRGALKPAVTKHQPAVIEPAAVGSLLRAIDGYSGYPPTVAALKLAAMLFVRPGELRQMRWADVDLDAAQWSYQPSKNGAPMITPLPVQAVEVLREMWSLSGRGDYVLPSARGRGRPMSENTVNAALHRLGFKHEMTAHGFRAMARTILVERLGYPVEHVEMQLGHAVRDINGRAYNRASYLEQRGEMLQAWANYLDTLRSADAAANVVPIRGSAGGR